MTGLILTGIVYAVFVLGYSLAQDGVDLCQLNCDSSDRLSGPTRPLNTLPHPWQITAFPSATTGFCKLGCQLFFSQFNESVTCLQSCDTNFRYRVTTGYSNIAEVATLECRDGCNIGLILCQAGFFCTDGSMRVCPAGKYRSGLTDVSTESLSTTSKCTDCPFGRYRVDTQGKSASDCTNCPIGTYANVTGAKSNAECLRCPAGRFSAQEGSQLCTCITSSSCNLRIDVGGTDENFFSDGVDYYRETVPYIGRW